VRFHRSSDLRAGASGAKNADEFEVSNAAPPRDIHVTSIVSEGKREWMSPGFSASGSRHLGLLLTDEQVGGAQDESAAD